jgi:hypothetical protein
VLRPCKLNSYDLMLAYKTIGVLLLFSCIIDLILLGLFLLAVIRRRGTFNKSKRRVSIIDSSSGYYAMF